MLGGVLPPFLDEARVGLLLIRPTPSGGQVLDANRATGRLLDTDHSDLISRSLGDLAVLAPVTDLAAQVDLVGRGELARGSAELVLADGSGVLSLTVTRAGAHAVLIELLDGTEEHQLRAEVAHEQQLSSTAMTRATSSFLDSVSHELRTPLAALLASTEMLDDGAAGDLTERQHALVSTLGRNGRRLNDLVIDLLDLASIDAGSFDLDRRDVDVRDVARAVHDDLGQLSAGRRLDIRLVVGPDPCVVHGDPLRLGQAMRHLLLNAVGATPDGGAVTVGVEAKGPQCVLTVSDGGPGILPEEQAHVFRPFHRTREAQERHRPGLGLGLSLARSIVAAHGGTLEVSSQPPAGSTFKIGLRRSPLAAGWRQVPHDR